MVFQLRVTLEKAACDSWRNGGSARINCGTETSRSGEVAQGEKRLYSGGSRVREVGKSESHEEVKSIVGSLRDCQSFGGVAPGEIKESQHCPRPRLESGQ